MGDGKTSPISAYDVARAVAAILKDPAPHIGHIYNFTGPRSETMDFYAGEFPKHSGGPSATKTSPPRYGVKPD
jgi:hypothetical protein